LILTTLLLAACPEDRGQAGTAVPLIGSPDAGAPAPPAPPTKTTKGGIPIEDGGTQPKR
jgi:hypothetical protein